METIYYDNKVQGFDYIKRYDESPKRQDFMLHNHDSTSEILFFLKGDSEFRVEGTVYKMHPYDIVIAGSHEMHRMWHNSLLHSYERVVISIKDRFFLKNSCDEFKRIFSGRKLGINNLYKAEVVKNNGIDSIFNEIESYIQDDDASKDIAIKSKIIDLLYKLNRISVKSDSGVKNLGIIKDILMYINDNITSPMTLDDIAAHFYISKYHLCHKFKQHTGLTIGKYVNHKRLLRARELCESGKSLTDASMEAGFGNYSNFYKVYVKEFAESPRNDIKKHF